MKQKDIMQAIDDKYAFPGGYPLFLITSDNACLCIDCGRFHKQDIRHSLDNNLDDGWNVVAADVNWEDQNQYCDHCHAVIECAYGE